MTKDYVRNVTTGEKIEVLPHTAGDGTFSFANADLADTSGWETPEVMYTFANENKDGEFTKPESTQLDVTGEWDFITEDETQ